MHTLQKTLRTGPDGVLRISLPTGEPDQAMNVVVVAHPVSEKEQQARLGEAEIRPPVQWNQSEPVPLQISGPPVADTLVEVRR